MVSDETCGKNINLNISSLVQEDQHCRVACSYLYAGLAPSSGIYSQRCTDPPIQMVNVVSSDIEYDVEISGASGGRVAPSNTLVDCNDCYHGRTT